MGGVFEVYGGCLEGVSDVFKECIWGCLRVPLVCLKGFSLVSWGCPVGCPEGVFWVCTGDSWGYLKGVFCVCGECLGVVSMVSQVCLRMSLGVLMVFKDCL